LLTAAQRKKKKGVRSPEDGARRTQPSSRLPVKFGAFASPGFRYKSLIISLSLRDIVSIIYYDATICMKLDPDIHIVKHLVFFGKSGMTPNNANSVSWLYGTKFPPTLVLIVFLGNEDKISKSSLEDNLL
jgi:hypothetical protein